MGNWHEGIDEFAPKCEGLAALKYAETYAWYATKATSLRSPATITVKSLALMCLPTINSSASRVTDYRLLVGLGGMGCKQYSQTTFPMARRTWV